MARPSNRFARALFASVLFVSPSAFAQGEKQPSARPPADPTVVGTGPDYQVTFDDDPLAAVPNGTIIPRITVRSSKGYGMLTRPRTSFVREMFKTVEQM